MRKRKEKKKEVFQALAMITQIALSMMTCIAISMYIGYWLDRLFDTKFIIIIMMFIGFGASIRSLFTITKSFTKDDDQK